MQAIINILKAKDIWMPLLTTCLGGCIAFQINLVQLRKKEKNEQIANLNYLQVTLHNFLTEMSYLDAPVEQKLHEAKKIKKIYNAERRLPSSIKPLVLECFAENKLVAIKFWNPHFLNSDYKSNFCTNNRQ